MIKVLNIRSWKLFLILCASIIVSFLVGIFKIEIGGLTILQTLAICRIIGLIILFYWLMLLGLQLNSIKENPYNFSKVLFVLAIFSAMSTYIEMNLQVLLGEFDLIPFYVGFILMPFTIWGLIFVFSRIAKSLNSLENNRVVTKSEYLKDSFLLFFFPVGVWIIQPRVNKIPMETEKRENK